MITFKKTYQLMLVLTLFFLSCVTLQENKLYIENDDGRESVFFTSSEIFADYLTSESWSTDKKECIQVESTPAATYKGAAGIHVTWDKTAQGCGWLGIGFGWDNWTGKNLEPIKYTGAIEFYAKMVEGERAVLPWAIALEDYDGAQAWLGLNPKTIKAEKVGTEWTRVELPIAEFDWADQQADITNIKQILFQLEADGDVYMDEIRVVPYNGGYRSRANVNKLMAEEFKIDGAKDDLIWQTQKQMIGDAEAHLALLDEGICVALEVKDDSPMQNQLDLNKIYEGDGFEMTFATDEKASMKRGRYLSSDQHLTFAFGKETVIFNNRTKSKMVGVETAIKQSEGGYIFEAFIPYASLNVEPLIPGEIYGLEMAVNLGTDKGRDQQVRWHSKDAEGYHENPSMWGELYVLKNVKSN